MTVPPTASTPGVFIPELNAFPGGITGVPTSITAFVGLTESGPAMQPTAITSWAAYQQLFGALAWRAMVSWSVYEFFREGGSLCYVVRAADLAGAKAATATAGAGTAGAGTGAAVFSAATPGAWGNALAVLAAPVEAAGATGATGKDAQATVTLSVLADAAAPDPLLQDYARGNNLAVRELDSKRWYVLEQFSGSTAATLAGKVNTQSIFLRVASAAANATATGATASPPSGKPVPLSGGTEPRPDFAAATALLDKVPDVSLLSVPDTVTASDLNGLPSLAQQAALINAGLLYCQNRGSLFYVADAPAGLSVEDVLSFKTGNGTAPAGNPAALTSDFGALYYPWVFIYNATAGANVPIPPSGPVLGRYAYTDATAGVFKPAAGTEMGALRSVVQLERSVTNTEQGQLNPLGINCIRDFSTYGNLIWGARTLSPSQEWTYLSVRRLFIYVQQSIQQGLQWTVFEPDSPAVQASVARSITEFLTGLWHQGGLFGSAASDAFWVTCDASNNPPASRLDGVIYVDIGLAPVYPAEFMVMRLQLQTAAPNV